MHIRFAVEALERNPSRCGPPIVPCQRNVSIDLGLKPEKACCGKRIKFHRRCE